jgi:hypothetical protein
MKTAVEWLINEIDMQYHDINIKRKEWMIEKAKEMEKKDIIMAYKADLHPCSDEDAEQYYNETFKQQEQ